MSDIKRNILKKFINQNFVLLKMEAKNLIDIHTKDGTEITQTSNYKYKVLEHTEELFKVRFFAHVFFEPETIFDIKLEYDLEFKLNEPIDEKDFRKHSEVILRPLGNQISYLVAFLSDSMMDQPLIIAPIIDEDDFQ